MDFDWLLLMAQPQLQHQAVPEVAGQEEAVLAGAGGEADGAVEVGAGVGAAKPAK